MIHLFEIEDRVIKPTVHCEMISWLRVIRENHPENYLKIYAYIFYMACPGEANPYFNHKEVLREELIVKDLEIDFSLEEDDIILAVERATLMYETPTVRAYKGITVMLDNITDYIESTPIKDGRDGNITSLIRIAKEFDGIRQSYKGVAKDMQAEQETQVYGSQKLAYDQ